jgi:protein SCO1/2
MKKPAFFLLAAAAILAAVAGAILARATLDRPAPALALQYGTPLVPAAPLPEFSLVADNGAPFTRADLEGQWTLMFFGFTHCPAVCPGTMTLLADVRKRLGDLPAGAQPRVVLVSVDPERDTPEVMGDYVRAFDPSFRGVTGSVEAIDAFAARMGIAHRKVPMGGEDYMIDHTAVVVLIDPEVRRTAIFSPPLEAQAIASDLRRALTGEHSAG